MYEESPLSANFLANNGDFQIIFLKYTGSYLTSFIIRDNGKDNLFHPNLLFHV